MTMARSMKLKTISGGKTSGDTENKVVIDVLKSTESVSDQTSDTKQQERGEFPKLDIKE